MTTDRGRGSFVQQKKSPDISFWNLTVLGIHILLFHEDEDRA